LRDPLAEHSCRFLQAADLLSGHSAVECVEVRHAEAGAAAAGDFAFPAIRASGGVVQGECGSAGREFGPGRRLEPERQSDNVSIETHRSCHIADEHDGVADSHWAAPVMVPPASLSETVSAAPAG